VHRSLIFIGLLAANPLFAQFPKLDAPRPIEAVDCVWIEDLTWLEVRDAMKAVIIPTDDVEPAFAYASGSSTQLPSGVLTWNSRRAHIRAPMTANTRLAPARTITQVNNCG